MTNYILIMDGQGNICRGREDLARGRAENGIDIPTICFHEATTSNALCRICVVEVEGRGCSSLRASSKRRTTKRSRREASAWCGRGRPFWRCWRPRWICPSAPEIQKMMDEYGADASRFPDAERRESEVKDDNPMYIRDYSKCLLCWRCVQVCAEDAQYTFAINFNGRGYETQIGTFFERTIPETTCVLCGQCVGVCPTGALKPKREFLLEQGMTPDQISVLNTGRKKRKS